MSSRSTRGRAGATLAVATAAVVAFGVVGGTGLAGGLAKPVRAQYGPGQYQYTAKVLICHKGKGTINVSVAAMPAHLRHGDVVGACAVVATAGTAKAAKIREGGEGREDHEERQGREGREVVRAGAHDRPGHVRLTLRRLGRAEPGEGERERSRQRQEGLSSSA